MMDKNMEKTIIELTEYSSSRFFGKYRGLVTNVNDPNNQGCIKAVVPEIYGKEESPWAFPSAIHAGPNYGFYILPKVKDGVWIEFEAGDKSRPIYSGFWWAQNELPKDAGEDKRILITPKGHKIILDDEGNKIIITHSDGAQINITKEDLTLKIGNSSIVLSKGSVNINDGALEIK